MREGQHIAQVQLQGVGRKVGAHVQHRQGAELKAHVGDQHVRSVDSKSAGVAGFMHAGYWGAGQAVAGEAERGQAQFGQGFDFACIAHAVLVGVLPDAEVGKLRVLGVKHAVVVAVKGVGQARQVGGGLALGGGGGVVLRKGVLAVVVHLAVVVLVPDQHPVLRAGPTGGVEQAVAVDVHHHVAVAQSAVVVEVDDDGQHLQSHVKAVAVIEVVDAAIGQGDGGVSQSRGRGRPVRAGLPACRPSTDIPRRSCPVVSIPDRQQLVKAAAGAIRAGASVGVARAVLRGISALWIAKPAVGGGQGHLDAVEGGVTVGVGGAKAAVCIGNRAVGGAVDVFVENTVQGVVVDQIRNTAVEGA